MQTEQNVARVSTGIAGLDQLLGSGIPAARVYLVEGDPGAGKTTLGLQFLREGIAKGENVLYVTLSETRSELAGVAASHGWTLDGMTLHELSPADESFRPDDQYTFFHPSEVELSVTTKAVLAEVERSNPSRVVFDSLSEMRLLAREPLRYRRQILGLKQFFVGRNCTVLLLDDRTSQDGDLQLQSLAHGVIALEQLAPEYGAERRRLRIIKMRGVRFQGGFHDFVISTGGLKVFPRLVAAATRAESTDGTAGTGIAKLDQLLGGGFDRGTSSLFIGPAGAGKSAIATQVAVTAADRGERVAIYLFDEGLNTFRRRAAGLGADVSAHVASGRIAVRRRSIRPRCRPVNSPTRFATPSSTMAPPWWSSTASTAISTRCPRSAFSSRSCTSYSCSCASVACWPSPSSRSTASSGRCRRRSISATWPTTCCCCAFSRRTAQCGRRSRCVKKRSGPHEKTIRELRLESSGISVGEPLTEFHGVLTGVPVFKNGGKARPGEV